MTDASRFWGNADQLPLTPFVDADFVEFDMDAAGVNGVQAKAFVRDAAGDAWLLKSGAYGDERSLRARPSAGEERTRRAALPVHEAIAARLLRTAGICTSDVDFAFHRLLPLDEPERLQLLVSAHRLLHGRRQDKIAAFAPSPAFVEDQAVAMCVNRVIGQRDHRLQNHLVGTNGRFIPLDNGDCMDARWLSTEMLPQAFADLTLSDALRQRLEPLTAAAVDSIFAALPAQAVAWHDDAVGLGYYAAGTLAAKRERVTTNVSALRRWAALR